MAKATMKNDARVNAGDERCPTCKVLVGTYRDFEGGRRYRAHSPWLRGLMRVRRAGRVPRCESSCVEVSS